MPPAANMNFEPETIAVDATPVSDDTQEKQTLSKSQKKRKKRNAAKAKKMALEKERLGAGVNGGGRNRGNTRGQSALNPHEQMKASLHARGFSYEEVDAAIEEMWNLQMKYDEFDAALAYLEARRAQSEVDGHRGKSGPVEEETTTASTAGSTTAALVQSAEENGISGGGTRAKEEAKEVMQEEVVQEESVAASEQASSAKSSTPSAGRKKHRSKGKKGHRHQAQPMDLSTKLNMVANYENLSDAIFALSEWSTKAAKAKEVDELCAAQNTRAFPTVVCRSINDCEESEFESSVRPAILNLIGGIFRAAGVPTSAITSSADVLSAVLRQARKAVTTANESGVGNDFTTTVADLIVSTVAKSAELAKFSTTEGSAETIRRIEEEIDALASSLVSNTSSGAGGVVDLMMKRDTHKAAAEKASTVVGITIVSSSVAGTKDENDVVKADASHSKLVVDGGDPLAALMSDEELEAVKTTRREFDDMSSRLADYQADTHQQRQALSSELGSYQTRKEKVNARMEELRREMVALEAEDFELGEKVTEVEAKIATLDSDCSEEAKLLRSQIAEKEKVVKFEDTARIVADKLESFGDSLLSSIAASAATQPVQNPGEKMSNKMGIYLVRMRNYFKAEADCVEFLSSRARSLESGLHDLQREIEECAALGMTTNVTQMTQTLSTTKQNIADDNSVVGALRSEAEKMRDDLMRRLEEYQTISKGNTQSNQAFTSLHVSVLNGIATALSRIGMNDDGGLAVYLASLASSDSELTVVASIAGEPIEVRVAPDEEDGHLDESEEDMDGDGPVTVTDMSTEGSEISDAADSLPTKRAITPPPAPVMPKLSWATKATGSKTMEVKSLVDIQKEELSAKDSN